MPLLSREFRLKTVEKIQGRRAVLIINGAPWTRTLAKRKMPAFTETGSISNCRNMLLYSPMALGDHLTERTERDVYDRDGRATAEHPVKKVQREGKTYAEVRIPGGYSAVIVRAAATTTP